MRRRKDAGCVEDEREIIPSQTHALVDRVDDLLDVARIARGDSKLDKRPLRMAEVVAESAKTAAGGTAVIRVQAAVNADMRRSSTPALECDAGRS